MKTKAQTKLLSIVLVLTMLVGMLTVIPFTVSAAETITIASVDDWMEKLSGKSVGDVNIVVTAAELDFAGRDVKVIDGFTGSFEGNGVVIKNVTMTVDDSSNNEVGLFHCSEGNPTFSNFSIESSSFSGVQWVGSVVCCAEGATFNNIYVGKDVTVYAAGKSGKHDGKERMVACTGGIMGGVLGGPSTTTFNFCTFEGTVSADGYANGGFVGNGNSGSTKAHNIIFNYCLVTGKVPNTGSAGNSCGFVGYNKDDTSKPYVTFNTCIYAGGAEDVYFYNRPFTTAPIVNATNCYTTHTAVNGVYANTKWTDEGSGVTLIDRSQLEGLNAIELEGFARQENGIMLPAAVLKGAGTEASPYLIGNAADWKAFEIIAANKNFSGEYIQIAADIDFADITIAPIQNFAGTLDGNGKTLKNITMSGRADIALFCELGNGAVLKNIVITDSSFTATKNWVGTVACCCKRTATLKNIYIAPSVTVNANVSEGDTAYAGGIIGGVHGNDTQQGNVTVENCVFAGTINANGMYSGGILSDVYEVSTATVKNCLNVGTINSAKSPSAGIATAHGNLTIENCVNAGVINCQGNTYAEIFAGNPSKAITIKNCYYLNGLVKNNTSNGGTVTEENNTRVQLSNLFGNNATVPATFAKRAGDIAVPAGCTVAPANIFGINMMSGAAVRMANPTGLRFTAMLGADYLNALVGDATDYSFGIIIAPTDYVAEANGTFTVESLKALSYEVAYKEIKAEKLQNDPTADGCYVFTGTLVNVQEANYTRDFSAIAYVKVGDTYYYSNYNEADNSRNIAEVAESACKDTATEQNEVYQYAVTEGETVVYSPYTEEQRKVLADFFQ